MGCPFMSWKYDLLVKVSLQQHFNKNIKNKAAPAILGIAQVQGNYSNSVSSSKQYKTDCCIVCTVTFWYVAASVLVFK